MSVLIVYFNLTTDEDYSELYSLIGDFEYLSLSDSCYLIYTKLSPKEIHLKLLPFIQPDDNFFIFRLTAPYHLHTQKHLISWVTEKIR